MNALEKLSNEQLLLSLENQFENERRTSHFILLHLKEIRTRRLYADRGFSSLFEMLIKRFHLSESSANQRLKALELMLAVPEVEESLKNGNVNLTTLAMAQRQIRREEKITGQKIDKDKKAEIVERIAGKTQAQTEKELLEILPESATAPQNLERRISIDATRLSLTLPDRVRDKLKKLKDIWAHVDPTMDYVELIERAADIALEKADRSKRVPKKQTQRLTDSVAREVISPPKRPTYYSIKTDNTLWNRASSRCEFVDQETGRRCTCTFGLERDHVVPIAKGGSNELSNLRLLCKPHNLMMARRHFGATTIDRKTRAKSEI
jgi:5-methylcytosine-specific restriction endonuclease McrA